MTSTNKPSVVLFDLGNVLVRIAPEAFLQKLGLDTPENRRFYQPHVTEIVRQYESGTDDTDEFLSKLDALFNGGRGEASGSPRGREFSPDDLRDAMLAIMQTPIEGMLELVTSLSNNVPLGLLSNTNPLHYEMCMNRYPALNHIHSHFLSYRLKALKPQPEIFSKVTKKMAVAPGEILYVDDLPENVEAGRNAGFNSYLFRGYHEFEQRLRTATLL
jgi:putative hydrolase of the HAD superfamily